MSVPARVEASTEMRVTMLSTAAVNHAKCPDCGSSTVKVLGRLPSCKVFAGRVLNSALAGGRLYRCDTCFLKFRQPAPTESTREHLYDNALTTAWAGEISNRPDWVLIANLIYEHGRDDAYVLDIGCYTGGLLKSLKNSFRKAGVEPNRAAARAATLEAKAQIWHSVNEIPRSEQFDFIVATDLIEHVDSPSAFIKSVVHLLQPNGLLIFSTGNGDALLARVFGPHWWYWFPVEHISFVSPSWIQYFCRSNAMTCVKLSYFAYRNLSLRIRLFDLLHAIAYGVGGRAYLEALTLGYKWTGRKWAIFPKGCGVTADHMIFALAPHETAPSTHCGAPQKSTW